MGDGTTSNGFWLTLGAAAKQSGIAKSSLSRAIRDGKMSALRCPETNSFKIDPSELHRYCEAVRIVRDTRDTVVDAAAEQEATGVQPVGTPSEQTALFEERAARELAEARLADLKAVLDDVRADREHWREEADQWREQAARAQDQASQAMRLLPGPRPERPVWWRWLKRPG